MNERLVVSESELARQRDFAARVRALPERPRSFHVVTMGCQMNERDSETIAGMLVEMGLRPERVRERADLILYNTCCVRENAENRALGNVIWLKELKKERPELLICVGGCMAQEAGMAERIKAMYPFIDLVFGTHNTQRCPNTSAACSKNADKWSRSRRATASSPRACRKSASARSPLSSTSCTAATTFAPTASCPMCAAVSARGSRRPCWKSASALWMRAFRRSCCWGRTSIPIAEAAASSPSFCGVWTHWACRAYAS